jgi:hypothetical protein
MSNGNGKKSLRTMVRYVAAQGIYEYKLDEDADVIPIPEDKVQAIVDNAEGKMKELLELLFENARKDPQGKWVEATNESVKAGQAVV